MVSWGIPFRTSANSLAIDPEVWNATPSAPANGPRPTTATNRRAKIAVSMARIPLSRPRRGGDSQGQGAVVRATQTASGSAAAAANAVPTTAIASVSHNADKKEGVP